MRDYTVRPYQPGFEEDQVRIGIEAARGWIWPYAYDMPALLRIHAQPDFDPGTRHYCFLGDKMVGYVVSAIAPPGDSGARTANLDFPRLMPGHEDVAEMLVERALETLRRRGISRVVGRVTTMCPADIRLAEKTGFTVHDWGYKVYYSYEMGRGKLGIPGDAAEEIDRERDLDECAALAARWYKRPPKWCRAHLEEWHAAGIITHLAVREQGKLIAACMAARNELRPSTAAIYYIYTPDEHGLRPMLAGVIGRCVGHDVQNVIADLINEHRGYGPVYQELGFSKVAEWARCEQVLGLS